MKIAGGWDRRGEEQAASSNEDRCATGPPSSGWSRASIQTAKSRVNLGALSADAASQLHVWRSRKNEATKTQCEHRHVGSTDTQICELAVCC